MTEPKRMAVRRRRGESGQTMAEFALTLILFMLIVLGIVDLSRAIYARNVVASAAREGARYATTHPPTTQEAKDAIKARAKELVVGLNRDELLVEVSQPDSKHVQVDVSYTFYPISAFIAQAVDGGTGTGLTLRGRSLMRTD